MKFKDKLGGFYPKSIKVEAFHQGLLHLIGTDLLTLRIYKEAILKCISDNCSLWQHLSLLTFGYSCLCFR